MNILDYVRETIKSRKNIKVFVSASNHFEKLAPSCSMYFHLKKHLLIRVFTNFGTELQSQSIIKRETEQILKF